jgi:hypothetical protein
VSSFVTGGKALLLTFQDYYGNEQENSCFYLFDSNGDKVFEKRINDLTYEYSFLLPGSDSSNGTFYFIKNRTTEIDEIDNNLKVKRSFTLPPVEDGEPIAQLDINDDGEEEYLFRGSR